MDFANPGDSRWTPEETTRRRAPTCAARATRRRRGRLPPRVVGERRARRQPARAARATSTRSGASTRRAAAACAGRSRRARRALRLCVRARPRQVLHAALGDRARRRQAAAHRRREQPPRLLQHERAHGLLVARGDGTRSTARRTARGSRAVRGPVPPRPGPLVVRRSDARPDAGADDDAAAGDDGGSPPPPPPARARALRATAEGDEGVGATDDEIGPTRPPRTAAAARATRTRRAARATTTTGCRSATVGSVAATDGGDEGNGQAAKDAGVDDDASDYLNQADDARQLQPRRRLGVPARGRARARRVHEPVLLAPVEPEVRDARVRGRQGRQRDRVHRRAARLAPPRARARTA